MSHSCCNCLSFLDVSIDGESVKCARCIAEERHDFDAEPNARFSRAGVRFDTPLPCPCCGGEAFYSPMDHETRADGRVECRECYLTVEESHGCEQPGTALTKWNRRVKC